MNFSARGIVMNRAVAVAILTLLGGPVNAEVLSLICEHGSGVSSRTGLPNAGYAEIFRIDFDTGKNKVVTPYFASLSIKFSVDDYSVAWSVHRDTANETYVYQLNRATGTLFVDISTADDRFVATGQCTKTRRIL